MHGEEDENGPCCSFFDIEQRLLQDHPLRISKALIDPDLKRMSPASDEMYSCTGRLSIPPAQCSGDRSTSGLAWATSSRESPGRAPLAFRAIVAEGSCDRSVLASPRS
jgi:hypothetical protein